jgi:hypothetical protein
LNHGPGTSLIDHVDYYYTLYPKPPQATTSLARRYRRDGNVVEENSLVLGLDTGVALESEPEERRIAKLRCPPVVSSVPLPLVGLLCGLRRCREAGSGAALGQCVEGVAGGEFGGSGGGDELGVSVVR